MEVERESIAIDSKMNAEWMEQVYSHTQSEGYDRSYPFIISDEVYGIECVWFDYKVLDAGTYAFLQLSKIFVYDEHGLLVDVLNNRMDIPIKMHTQKTAWEMNVYLNELSHIMDTYDVIAMNHLIQDGVGKEFFNAYCTVRSLVHNNNKKKQESIEKKQVFIRTHRNVVEKASELLRLTCSEVIEQSSYIDDLGALYVWQNNRGGASLIIDENLERLGGVSSISLDQLIKAFRSGKRS